LLCNDEITRGGGREQQFVNIERGETLYQIPLAPYFIRLSGSTKKQAKQTDTKKEATKQRKPTGTYMVLVQL